MIARSFFLLLSWTLCGNTARAWTNAINTQKTCKSTTALDMSTRYRGLEQRREGATPTAGGMTLYLKAGPDGKSVGDCPFAHFVRMVLEEKGLEYNVLPTTQDTKPNWLKDHYEGKMPALQHRKECYVESDVIADYLEFFFPDPSLKTPKDSEAAEDATEGFFPAVAKYLKDTSEDSEDTLPPLRAALRSLDDHLGSSTEYLCGDKITTLDCSLAPKLYHLTTAIEGLKGGVPDLESEYENLAGYYRRMSERPSFQATLYPKETVLWGWGNARK